MGCYPRNMKDFFRAKKFPIFFAVMILVGVGGIIYTSKSVDRILPENLPEKPESRSLKILSIDMGDDTTRMFVNDGAELYILPPGYAKLSDWPDVFQKFKQRFEKENPDTYVFLWKEIYGNTKKIKEGYYKQENPWGLLAVVVKPKTKQKAESESKPESENLHGYIIISGSMK